MLPENVRKRSGTFDNKTSNQAVPSEQQHFELNEVNQTNQNANYIMSRDSFNIHKSEPNISSNIDGLRLQLKRSNSIIHIEVNNQDIYIRDQPTKDEVMKLYASNQESQKEQEEESDDDSLEEREKGQKLKIQQNIRQNNLEINAQKKMFIGSGFTFDMTDFFKFNKKEALTSGASEATFFQEISGSPLAWIILLYTVTSSALIPGWIMNINANKFSRKTWRFFMQALLVIPFMLYQKRKASPQMREQYKLHYIFNFQNLVKPYVSSLSASMWFLIILTSFQWTYVSHGIVLGNLSNFFLSIGRTRRGQSHQLQSGGQVLVILGMLLIFHDTITINSTEISTDDLGNLNTFFLRRTWWQRLAGDFAAIATSFFVSQFSKYTSDLRSYYPPFLSMFLINCFNTFHMCIFSYFVNGSSFNFDSYWGLFSVFSYQHFISFMYMAIVLAFGQIISVFLITRMFPDPIIPALALCLQPFIASFLVQLGNVQNLPGGVSMMGYLFIFPGMLTVLMGQCFFQRQKSSNDQSQSKMKVLLDEIKHLREVNLKRTTRIAKKTKSTINRPLGQSVAPNYQHK